MREVSALSVGVVDLIGRPGSHRHVDFSALVEAMGLDMGGLVDEIPLHFDLELESVVEGILVSGTVSGEAEMECCRCLGVFRLAVEARVRERFSLPGDTDAEEGYGVVDDVLPLETMTRDALLLAIAVNPLCRNDCRGLCSECGADLNAGECAHAAGAGSPAGSTSGSAN